MSEESANPEEFVELLGLVKKEDSAVPAQSVVPAQSAVPNANLAQPISLVGVEPDLICKLIRSSYKKQYVRSITEQLDISHLKTQEELIRALPHEYSDGIYQNCKYWTVLYWVKQGATHKLEFFPKLNPNWYINVHHSHCDAYYTLNNVYDINMRHPLTLEYLESFKSEKLIKLFNIHKTLLNRLLDSATTDTPGDPYAYVASLGGDFEFLLRNISHEWLDAIERLGIQPNRNVRAEQ